MRADDGIVAQVRQEGEAHVGQRRLGIHAGVGLHGGRQLAHRRDGGFRQVELAGDQLVALDHLRGGKTRWDGRLLGVRLDDVRRGMDAAVHRAERVVLLRACGAEVDAAGRLVEARHMQGVVDQLVDALVLRRGNGHHGNAQLSLELVHAHGAAVGLDLVHHVERQHHGDAQLHDLHGQVQVALDVGAVDDVDDSVGFLVEQEVARDDLLVGVRRQRVHARQVGDGGLGVPADGAVLAIDRDAREVADVLVRARELVEQRGLAAVLVAHQREGERAGLRGGAARVGAVGLLGRAELAEAGVRQRGAVGTGCGSRGGTGGLRARDIGAGRGVGAILQVERPDMHVVGFAQAQRQLVAAHRHLNRIAHGGRFLQRDHRIGSKPHIQ